MQRLTLAIAMMLAPAALLAQPSAADLAHGRAIFESQCARCHGIDGSGGMGANLRRPTLRRAPTDSALADLIVHGIPERGMPDSWQISPREAMLVAAYVRTFGRAAAEPPLVGDSARGRALFVARGACTSCHMVRGEGGSLGPDLSDVGLTRSSAYLRRALREPGAELPSGSPPGYAVGGEYTKWLPIRATTTDGRTVTGLRVNEDAFTIQLRDAANHLISLDKATLRSMEKLAGRSLMPAYDRAFTATELDDVIAYLASLKGTTP